MKDAGIYLGSVSGTVTTWAAMGDISGFSWWQWILIGFYYLLVAIVGGVVGMAIQDTILKTKEKWIGEKRELKPSI